MFASTSNSTVLRILMKMQNVLNYKGALFIETVDIVLKKKERIVNFCRCQRYYGISGDRKLVVRTIVIGKLT